MTDQPKPTLILPGILTTVPSVLPTGFLAVGPCWICREVFTYDPSSVRSIYVNPDTNKPLVEGDDSSTGRREALCTPCCAEIIESRAKNDK